MTQTEFVSQLVLLQLPNDIAKEATTVAAGLDDHRRGEYFDGLGEQAEALHAEIADQVATVHSFEATVSRMQKDVERFEATHAERGEKSMEIEQADQALDNFPGAHE